MLEGLKARADKQRNNGEDGFSLVELLIYIVIVAILIAIAIPLFNSYRKSGIITSNEADVKSAITAVEASYTATGQYPANTAALATGFKVDSDKVLAYGVDAAGETFCVSVEPAANKQGAGDADYRVDYYSGTDNGPQTNAAAAVPATC